MIYLLKLKNKIYNIYKKVFIQYCPDKLTNFFIKILMLNYYRKNIIPINIILNIFKFNNRLKKYNIVKSIDTINFIFKSKRYYDCGVFYYRIEIMCRNINNKKCLCQITLKMSDELKPKIKIKKYKYPMNKYIYIYLKDNKYIFDKIINKIIKHDLFNYL